jgi:hypothetical protein
MGGAGEGTAFVHQALLKALDRAPGYAPEMDPIAMDWPQALDLALYETASLSNPTNLR